MSILVTGAGGLIGSHLCQYLISCNPDRVIGLVRSTPEPRAQVPGVNYVFGDLLNTPGLTELVYSHKVDTVFHLAAVMPYSLNQDFIGVNVAGTLNLLKAIYASGVKTLAYASSLSVYSEPLYLPVDEDHPKQPTSPYGLTKLAGELACNKYPIPPETVIILRYSGVYGPGMNPNRAIAQFANCALKGQPIAIFGSGEQSRDWVSVHNAVLGTYLAWKRGVSGVFNIGSGQETTVLTLAKMIIDLTKSHSLLVINNGVTDRPFKFALDITKAKRELGYQPCLLADGLERYLETLV